MKDLDRLKGYRKKYKRYYGIEFDRSYAIHHIDGNHENNDECGKWYDFKLYLDGELPNIHGITLEG